MNKLSTFALSCALAAASSAQAYAADPVNSSSSPANAQLKCAASDPVVLVDPKTKMYKVAKSQSMAADKSASNSSNPSGTKDAGNTNNNADASSHSVASTQAVNGSDRSSVANGPDQSSSSSMANKSMTTHKGMTAMCKSDADAMGAKLDTSM